MSYLEQEASRLSDLQLSKPVPHDHMLNVTYLMDVLTRAQNLLIQHRHAIQDAKLPVELHAFDKAFWALEGVYVTLTPIVLANANAVLATAKAVRA